MTLSELRYRYRQDGNAGGWDRGALRHANLLLDIAEAAQALDAYDGGYGDDFPIDHAYEALADRLHDALQALEDA